MRFRRTTVLSIALTLSCRGTAPPAAAPIAAAPSRGVHTAADAHFMSGMIVHHNQAVLMAGWSADPAREASPAIRGLSERIVVAQQDEIAMARRWLEERHEREMDHPMMMPGMLSQDQLTQLQRARGVAYDRLFLTFMIQHHQGALAMVDQLLGVPGAAQDGLVFRFAADVHADQTTEIARMQRMLAELGSGGRGP